MTMYVVDPSVPSIEYATYAFGLTNWYSNVRGCHGTLKTLLCISSIFTCYRSLVWHNEWDHPSNTILSHQQCQPTNMNLCFRKKKKFNAARFQLVIVQFFTRTCVRCGTSTRQEHPPPPPPLSLLSRSLRYPINCGLFPCHSTSQVE